MQSTLSRRTSCPARPSKCWREAQLSSGWRIPNHSWRVRRSRSLSTVAELSRENVSLPTAAVSRYGPHAYVPREEDFPAYLLEWEQALRRHDVELSELTDLSTLELADFLAECAATEKKSAISLAARIIRHLLCLKYASGNEFDPGWRHWSVEVETLRQELMQVCKSKTVEDHLAGELTKAYKDGVKQFRAHQFNQTIGNPAATFRKEGLSLERLMEQWWPERLRNLLEPQVSPQYW